MKVLLGGNLMILTEIKSLFKKKIKSRKGVFFIFKKKLLKYGY